MKVVVYFPLVKTGDVHVQMKTRILNAYFVGRPDQPLEKLRQHSLTLLHVPFYISEANF